MVINREDLACAAGFFNGEGSTVIGWSKDKSYAWLSVSIFQNYREPLEQFQAAVNGLGNVRGPYQRPDGNPYYSWTAQNFEHVQAVIAMLWFKLSSVKRQQAIKALKAFSEYHSSLRIPKGTGFCFMGHSSIYYDTTGNKRCRECADRRRMKHEQKNNRGIESILRT